MHLELEQGKYLEFSWASSNTLGVIQIPDVWSSFSTFGSLEMDFFLICIYSENLIVRIYDFLTVENDQKLIRYSIQ